MIAKEAQRRSQINIEATHATTPQDNSELQSLHDRCSILRGKLIRVCGFAKYFPQNGSSDSENPVSQLWNIFSAGVPLCYLFNQLPEEAGFGRIVDQRFDWDSGENDDERIRVRAIAHFCMCIRGYKIQQQIPGIELFKITDLWERNSTKGFAKVVRTVSAIVDYLPPDAFLQSREPDSGIHAPTFLNIADHHREFVQVNIIIKEIIETERNYGRRLEDTLTFSDALSKAGVIDPNLIFLGIAQLVDCQRKLLSLMEETASLEFENQRWGRCFLECEEELADVYVPYCANYPRGKTILEATMNVKQPSIPGHSSSVHDTTLMLVSPVSRICKYPLLLEALLKALSSSTYPHLKELERGLEASKRVRDKINEAIRKSENEQTALELSSRVHDWKGFVPTPASFGELLLHEDCLLVTSSDIDQAYSADDDFCLVSRLDVSQTLHVFLFEQILILCDEEEGADRLGKTRKPSNSSSCPLLLKGHIFLDDISRAIPTNSPFSRASRQFTGSSQPNHPLTIWWRYEDQQEASFTLRFKYESQTHQWQARISTILQGQSQSSKRTSTGTTSTSISNTQNKHINPGSGEKPIASMLGRLYSALPRSNSNTQSNMTQSPSLILKSHLSLGNSQSVKHVPPTIPPPMTPIPIPSTPDSNKQAFTIPSTSHGSNPSTPNAGNVPNANIDGVNSSTALQKVEIKVIFRDDVFLLHLPLTTTYEDLRAKVVSSSRLGVNLPGPVSGHVHEQSYEDQLDRQHPLPLRMKYIDEDGDAVSLKSSEDVQMFFEHYQTQTFQPKRPVVLLVTR